MPAAYNVAILGASGAVGAELMQILEERAFPVKELRLLASPRSAGKRLPFKGEELTVQAVSDEAFSGVDLAFFCAGGGVSKEWAPRAVRAGALVIDNSSFYRLDEDVPLVVPEVNGDAIRRHQGIIANANCSTTILVMALAPIHRRVGVRRVVVSTYQAVSGAGVQAMEELDEQLERYLKGEPIEPGVLPVASAPRHHQIALNVIPQIDVFAEMGYTKEEWKMVHETRKIMEAPDLLVSPTTVRVPVMRSHSESLNIETLEPISPDEVREILSQSEGVTVLDDPEAQAYPMPLHAAGTDPVFVGRIRKDPTIPNGINMWVVGDQIRKGAALNAVQIAEYAVANQLLAPASMRA